MWGRGSWTPAWMRSFCQSAALGEGESVFFKGAALLGCLCSSGWSRTHVLWAALRRVSVVFKKRGGTHQVGGCWGCGGDVGGNVGEWMVDMVKIGCIHVRN